jgi:hypothetical protein
MSGDIHNARDDVVNLNTTPHSIPRPSFRYNLGYLLIIIIIITIIIIIIKKREREKNGPAQIRTATLNIYFMDKNIANVQAITPQGPLMAGEGPSVL